MVAVAVVLRTPSATSVESLDILRGSVAVVEEAMGGVEALALAVGVLIMDMDAGEFLTKTLLLQ